MIDLQTEIRDNIKKKLATCYQMAEELKDIEDDMAKLEELKAAIRAQVITGMPRGSTVGDPTGSMAIRARALEEHYEKLKSEALDRQLELENMIAPLEVIERRIIRLRFMHALTWPEVGRRVSYSEQHTRRLYDASLDKLVELETQKRNLSRV